MWFNQRGSFRGDKMPIENWNWRMRVKGVYCMSVQEHWHFVKIGKFWRILINQCNWLA